MTAVLQCVRLKEIPSEDLQQVVLPSGLYSKETIQLAQCPAIVSTRGKHGMLSNVMKFEIIQKIYMHGKLFQKIQHLSCCQA